MVMAVLLILALLFSVWLDSFTTYICIQRGLVELNPFLRGTIDALGIELAMIVKMLVSIAYVFIILHLSHLARKHGAWFNPRIFLAVMTVLFLSVSLYNIYTFLYKI